MHGGWLHLILNMFALYDLGKKVEARLGSLKFISLYLICGIAAGVFALFWLNERNLVGASGSIFGLFGAYIWLTQNKKNSFERVSKLDLFSSIAISFLPGVSFAAHFGGFFAGWICAKFLKNKNDN